MGFPHTRAAGRSFGFSRLPSQPESFRWMRSVDRVGSYMRHRERFREAATCFGVIDRRAQSRARCFGVVGPKRNGTGGSDVRDTSPTMGDVKLAVETRAGEARMRVQRERQNATVDRAPRTSGESRQQQAHFSPLICHALVGRRLRHRHGPGTVVPQRRSNNYDPHLRFEPWRARRP